MAGKKTRKDRKLLEAVETEPDGWERFQRTMDKIVPPKRPKPKKEAPEKKAGSS